VTSLLGLGFEGLAVLDAFAGSGALGIEALSRGASRALFVDNDARAVSCVKANLQALGLADGPEVAVIKADSLARSAPTRLAAFAPYGLVCLDPPYAIPRQRVASLLTGLASQGLLAHGCLVSYESRAAKAGKPPYALAAEAQQAAQAAAAVGGAELAYWPKGLQMVSFKSYGDTAVEYYLYQGIGASS
jgi:16S rRNA (guanine966-N2)-methyltransferase